MTRALPLLDAPPALSDDAGIGALETSRGCLPLVALEVRGRIAALLGHTSVRQTFRNPFNEPLEATYIFPLPDRAAVTRFRMTVAGRVIEGELKERGKAREEYEQAIEQGHRAAIAEEERSGVFTLRVGNIAPREEAVVELEMVGPLEVSDDEATYRFPLVVAPRYTPGTPLEGDNVGDGWAADTDQVPDASRITPPVLLPGFPNPVRLSLEVELDPAGLGDGLAGVRSSLHTVIEEQGPPWKVRLQSGERLNRDFILRFPVAKKSVQTSLQCSPASKDKPGVFALTLTPPAMSVLNPKPREVVFVLDRSGSMGGWKMVAARRALGRMVDTLLEQDRFTVIAFDDQIETPDSAPKSSGRGKRRREELSLMSGSNRNRWRVLEWLGKIEARGGTEMGPALERAMKYLSPASPQADRVLVVVTDGQVTGEDALLASLQSAAGAMPQIFTLGIDQAVNAGFLRRLAGLGGGVCDLVESEDRLDDALERVHRLIGQPVLTDVRLELLDFDGVSDSLSPARTAGLFADRPLMIFGRHLSEKPGVRLRVHAVDAHGKPWSTDIAAQAGPADVLINLWGRAKVRELEDEYAAKGARNENLADRIVKVSLESGVLSRFTAYVAVDRSEMVNAGGEQHKIIQPVEVPAGWDDDATLAMSVRAAPVMMRAMAMGGLTRGARFRKSAPEERLEALASVDSYLMEFDDTDMEFSDDDGNNWRSNMLGELLGLFTGRRRKSFDWSKLDTLVADMWAEAQRLQQSAAPTREEIADLVATLHALVDVLAHAKHAARDRVKQLADEGQAILVAWPAEAPRLTAYLDAVSDTLEKLADPAQRKRKAFWK
jgi:Ca-activated chloride channel family protein